MPSVIYFLRGLLKGLASRSGDKIGATHNGHSGQFLWPQFCHPNSEAPIIARKAIPKLTEMDKLPVLNTSAQGVTRYLGVEPLSLSKQDN